jgi:glutathione S-transferase
MILAIGNKSYSSWSLRAWLAVRKALGTSGFKEYLCPLAGSNASEEEKAAKKEMIRKHSPTGKVPALVDPDINAVVCDSLAIILHICEKYPLSALLPKDDLKARALCISACSEMHSGFTAIRTNLPMNCTIVGRKHGQQALARADVQEEVERLKVLWEDLRSQFGGTGPYLFGTFTAADCMFAPIALRFRTYDRQRSQLSIVRP